MNRRTFLKYAEAGLTASLCKKHSIDPDNLYDQHLTEFKELLIRGVDPTNMSSNMVRL